MMLFFKTHPPGDMTCSVLSVGYWYYNPIRLYDAFITTQGINNVRGFIEYAKQFNLYITQNVMDSWKSEFT